MIRKTLLFVGLFGSIAVACSDGADDSSGPGPGPGTPACESELTTGIALAETFAYTGSTYTMSGTRFCKADLVAVVLNETEVTPADIEDTRISFVVPKGITTDSATLKIKTKTATIDLHKKIAIFPGGGNWTPVLAFPGEVRTFAQATVLNGKVYISGGDRFTGYAEGTYPTTNYNDLYKFDPVENSWTKITEDDKFKSKTATASWDNKLFLFPNKVSGPVVIYDVNTATFDETKSYSGGFALNAQAFTLNNVLFSAVTDNSLKKITIRKYDAGTKEWNIVYMTDFNADNTYLDFAIEHDGNAYLGWNAPNSSVVELWTYNATENKLTKINTINVPAPNSTVRMRHLFTLGALAYFIENGDASLDPQGAKVTSPSPRLYLLNLKTKTWRSVSHTFPEVFYGSVFFGVNGRGFAGISANSGTPAFTFSSKVYEFRPE